MARRRRVRKCWFTTRKIRGDSALGGGTTYLYTVRRGRTEVAYGGGRRTRVAAVRAAKAAMKKHCEQT